MAGRPSKLTAEVQARICEAIEAGATYADASAYAGVDYQTFRNWMKEGQESKRKNKFFYFFEAVEASNAKVRKDMAQVIVNSGKGGDWRAAESFLKRRDPANWGDRQDITTGGQPMRLVWPEEQEDRD